MVKRISTIVLAAMMMAGCADQIQPPTKHAPITSAQVKLYQEAPSRYEQLGLLHVATGGEVKFDSMGDANAGFEQFKAQAAAMGANGVLFVLPGSGTSTTVTAGYKGVFYTVPMKMTPTRQAVAQAIYVIKE